MSDIKISKPCKQRFKGVEHFLRRIAFNLGNTPSQTEVKIISCIPVDVTDLQAKIQFLERQLQETGRYHDRISKSKTSAQVTPPLEPLKGRTEINKDDEVGPAITKGGEVSDKSGAVERVHCSCRVGETNGVVSMKNGAVADKNGTVSDKNGTEDNVISDKGGAVERAHCSCRVGKTNGVVGKKNGTVCDKNCVWDNVFGDKGGANERVHCGCRVHETNDVVGKKNDAVGHKNGTVCDKNCAKDNVVGDKGGAVNKKNGAVSNKSNKPNAGGTVVNTILYGGPYANQSNTIDYSSDKSLRSDTSRYKPSYSDSGACGHIKSNVSFVLPGITTTDKGKQPYCSTSSYENADPDNPVRNIAEAERKLAATERYYNKLFKKLKRKKKVCKGKSKLKTHLVYFTQHIENNPFNANVSLDVYETLNSKTASLSHAYLNNVIQKQYNPKFVVQEFSDTSHFSRPICRDNGNEFARSGVYESDVCSCCHGRFQNIDNYMSKDFDFINELTQCEPNYTNKTYYDSNLYDVVPVKETTNRILKDGNSHKMDIEIRCWPEKFCSKYRHDPKASKFQAETPFKRRGNLTVPSINHKKKSAQCKVDQKRINKQVHETSKVTPKTCYIDYRDVNRNDTFPSAKVKQSEPVKTIVLKNESNDTDDLNTNLFNNQSTQLQLIPDDNKTESILSQIKSILLSFLAEVKTNSKVNGSTEKSSKRDAVVQKGASQYNMQGQSTLLHSFTYNHSFNANPHLLSCSRQLSAGQYCLAGVPYQPAIKYFQNFPVFVQPSSGRRLCACYYKNSSHKSSKYKQASAAATNTDKGRPGDIQKNDDGNKETEKLIKEIYKSMAATKDFPTKENYESEYEDVKSTENDFITKSNTKDVRNADTVVNKRDIEVEALLSSNVSSNSELVYTTSTQLKEMTRTMEEHHYDKSIPNETNHEKLLHRFERSAETILEDDEETDTSSYDTENVDIIKEFETPPKHERKGLLQRMFNSVKMCNKRKADQKIQNESEVSGASDSADYETIYLGRTAVLQLKNHRQSYQQETCTKGRLEDQNAYIRSLHEKGRRSPYLEQEYRRQWNERIMFDKQQERKCSYKRPLSKQSPAQDARPVY